jgi:predicted acyltransferase
MSNSPSIVTQTGKLAEPGKLAQASQRLLSLDFMRGLTMVLLTLESAELYSKIQPAVLNTPLIHVLNEFFHHPWHGLHLWDLVQPVFMFVAGTAMAFSYRKQRQTMTWNQSFVKTLKRCFWLFFWGVLDYAVTKNGLELRLWDVLTQLAFTTLVTFLIMSWDVKWQIVVSFLCLLIPEFLYRFTHIPGYDQPFTDQHNFGNYMDMVLMGRVNDGGWVAINCVSTSAHTIWGAMAGQLLLSNKSNQDKVKYLVISGLVLLGLGFGLDWTAVTPIIKRIATSSFVLAAGGWALLFLALCYWWVDVRKHQKNLLFFLIFGMNSIFIYLFFEIVGDRWFTGYIFSITNGLFGFIHFPVIPAEIIGSLVVFGLEAGIMYFLYRRKIFFKL